MPFVSENNQILLCPECNSFLKKRNGKYGMFYGCSNYPTCKYTYYPDIPENLRCPICAKPLIKRDGKKGEFLGCLGFPTCNYTRPIKDSDYLSLPIMVHNDIMIKWSNSLENIKFHLEILKANNFQNVREFEHVYNDLMSLKKSISNYVYRR